MIERRTRALFEFGIGVVALFAQLRFWNAVGNRDAPDNRDGGNRVSRSGVALGALYGILSLWVRDRDVAGIRTSRRRNLLFSLFRVGLRRRLLPQSRAFRRGLGVGQTAGLVVYRFWYGVLRPLPGTGE